MIIEVKMAYVIDNEDGFEKTNRLYFGFKCQKRPEKRSIMAGNDHVSSWYITECSTSRRY